MSINRWHDDPNFHFTQTEIEVGGTAIMIVVMMIRSGRGNNLLIDIKNQQLIPMITV